MKLRTVLYGVLLTCSLHPATATALPFEVGGTLGMENFNWQEFDISGQKSEQETGARLTLSAFLHSKPEPKSLPMFVYGAAVSLSSGNTDYSAPAAPNSGFESTWEVLSLTGEVGLRLGSMPFAWEFLAQPAIHFWSRTLDDNLDQTSRSVQAKQEDTLVYSLGLGTGPAWRSGKWYGRLIGGLKYAGATVLINDDYSDVYNEDVEIDIEGETTGFITIDNNIRVTEKMHLIFDGYYDIYHFKRSDPQLVNGGTTTVIVPERKHRTYGVRAGVSMDF